MTRPDPPSDEARDFTPEQLAAARKHFSSYRKHDEVPVLASDVLRLVTMAERATLGEAHGLRRAKVAVRSAPSHIRCTGCDQRLATSECPEWQCIHCGGLAREFAEAQSIIAALSEPAAPVPAPVRRTLDVWVCPDCGPMVKADEGGCCSGCGSDCTVERWAVTVGEPDAPVPSEENEHEQREDQAPQETAKQTGAVVSGMASERRDDQGGDGLLSRGGPHLINGEFQSDKYPTTPRGKVPLSCKDPTAQDLLWEYAQRRRVIDAEFAADLEQALRTAGYAPVPASEPTGKEGPACDPRPPCVWCGERWVPPEGADALVTPCGTCREREDDEEYHG